MALKHFCKFHVNIPVNTRVTAVKISIHKYCGSSVDRQKNACQPIFPYNKLETSPTSLTWKSVFIGPNDFSMILFAISKLGQIDHHLHNHVFDDIICKPSIVAGEHGKPNSLT